MIFGEISEDVRKVLDEVFDETNLFNVMNIKYYSVQKQKSVIKIVKLSPVGESVSKMPSTIVVTVVENIFERLTPIQQKMLVEDAVNLISYDDEKDKIKIEAPTINMSIGGWRKYGAELANTYELCTLTAQQMEEEEKEAKKLAKEAKKAKRKE